MDEEKGVGMKKYNSFNPSLWVITIDGEMIGPFLPYLEAVKVVDWLKASMLELTTKVSWHPPVEGEE